MRVVLLAVPALLACNWVLPLAPGGGSTQGDGGDAAVLDAVTDGRRLDVGTPEAAVSNDLRADAEKDSAPADASQDLPTLPDQTAPDGGVLPGATLWAKAFGGTGDDLAYGLALDGNGAIYLTGELKGTVSFGPTSLLSQGDSDIYIASLSAAGAHRWALAAGGTTYDRGAAVAAGGGYLHATGAYTTGTDFGGGALPAASVSDVYVARFTTTGAHSWSYGLGGSSGERGEAIARDSSGNVYITGYFAGSTNLGGNTLTANGLPDIFLASYNASGGHRWSKHFGGAGWDSGLGLAVDGADNVYVTGYFDGQLDMGTLSASTAGLRDIFVASFDKNGGFLWAKVTGGPGNDQGNAIAVDQAGNVYVTGEYNGTVNFGGSAAQASAGQTDVFVLSYGSSGTFRWAKAFGNTSADRGYGLAVAGNNLYVTGDFYYKVDFGGGPLTSQGRDGFVASYTTLGAHRWSRALGGPLSDQASAVAADGTSLYVAGDFRGTADFGTGSLTSVGGADVFVVRLAP